MNRTGYITISGGVKLAYDLTLPAASGRFPVALEYDHYTVGSDNGANQAGMPGGERVQSPLPLVLVAVAVDGRGVDSGPGQLFREPVRAVLGADEEQRAPRPAGGVGVFVVQLAKLAGATVIGTASESTFEFLRQLGTEPVAYGPGLADRVRTLAPDGVTAATDLFGTETAQTALALGVPPERISTIAAGPNPPGGVRATWGNEAGPADLERITDAILTGKITVPIAATFPIEQIRDAVALQAGRHVHGKIVITL